MDTNINHQTGRDGEDLAEKYYLARGYRTLARNFRVKEGELDLVVQRGDLLLFVEVKTRSRDWESSAWYPAWRGKQRRLRAAVRRFLLEHKELVFMESRLEVVFVTQGRVAARFEGI